MKFENSWVIAGVRGTSIAIQWDNITIYQSQGFGGFAKYGAPTADSNTIDLSKCSSFNVKSQFYYFVKIKL